MANDNSTLFCSSLSTRTGCTVTFFHDRCFAWSGGRWPGKDALEFKCPGDHVRINIPGKFDNLTLAAWIRADGLPNRYQSLLLTDGNDVRRPIGRSLRKALSTSFVKRTPAEA